MDEWIAKVGTIEFLNENYPVITDYFFGLKDNFYDFKPKKTISKIIGLYPSKKIKYSPKSLTFSIFNSNRTYYAMLKELSPIFTGFFMKTSIFPVISSYPIKFYYNPDLLPKKDQQILHKQGVLLYGIEE